MIKSAIARGVTVHRRLRLTSGFSSCLVSFSLYIRADRQCSIASGTLGDLTQLTGHPKFPPVTLPLVHQSVPWLEIAAQRHSSLFRLMDRPDVDPTGEPILRQPPDDRGERCAASRVFSGSSPTANLVSIIKGQRKSWEDR